MSDGARYFEEEAFSEREKIRLEDKADVMGRLGVALGKSKAEGHDEIAGEIASAMTWLEDKKLVQNGGED